MADNERPLKKGIHYYSGTKIRRGTTAWERPVPMYPVEGGSGDVDTASPDIEAVERVQADLNRLSVIVRNHSIYSSPTPKWGNEIRYIRSGGWQAIRKEDRGKIVYGD